MARHPLILSALPYDIHAHAVCWALERSGLSPIWAGSPAEENVPPLSLVSDGDSPWRATGWDDIGAVWYRRARNPESFPRAAEQDAPFLRTEWARFLRNAYALASEQSNQADRLWVNPPAAAVAAENKLVQLAAAERCGVRFPATLVSHDPAAIRRFVEKHRRVVYKSFMPHTWKDASGRMLSTFARILEPDMLDDRSLALCPGIFQAYVDKRHDLRVIAVGDRFFTVSLRSATGEAFVDWRAHTYEADMRAEPAALPGGYQERLQSLLRELGLVFGCIDVVIDTGGEAQFLEVNQAGQFLFIEEMVESLPLLRAMSALLASGRTDYSLDTSPDVTYRAYTASEPHQAWWDKVRGLMDAANQAGAWLTVE